MGKKNKKQKKRKQQAKSKKSKPAGSTGLVSPDKKILQAHRCLQTGDLAHAEQICRQILQADPSHAEAINLLGLIALQVKNHELAIFLIKQAVTAEPQNWMMHCNLGEAYRSGGIPKEAMACYNRTLELNPGSFEAHYNKGVIFGTQNKLNDAIECYRCALKIKPEFASGHYNLGNAYKALKKYSKAIESYKKALEHNPAPDTHYNLALAYFADNQVESAIESYRKAIQIKSDYIDAYIGLATIFQALGNFEEAEASSRKALEIQPDHHNALNILGVALQSMGKNSEAAEAYQHALELQPDFFDAHYNMGQLLKVLGKPQEAAPSFQRALDTKPDAIEAHIGLGTTFMEAGRFADAISVLKGVFSISPDHAKVHLSLGNAYKLCGDIESSLYHYRQAMKQEPNIPEAFSNFLLTSNSLSDLEPAEVFKEHCRWAKKFACFDTSLPLHSNQPDPERPLRIGYVSPDFRTHSVAYFLLPILRNHNPDLVKAFCYAKVPAPDAATALLREYTTEWRDICRISDYRVAELIRADQIDILVDLAGHTRGNSLLVFAQKPAPIQITYLGYPNTTGLPAIDYRITDAWADPVGQTDQYHSEQLIRLPHGFLCYAPAVDAPAVQPLPAMANGHITFGSFNNLAKTTPNVIALWARLLKSIPTARLVLKTGGLSDESTRERYFKLFRDCGIEEKRLELIGHVPSSYDHLAAYNRIDIGLDPFPYNGTTTTCEAFWMGVPAITLSGKVHAGRVGVSLLHAISEIGSSSLPMENRGESLFDPLEWIATSEQQYIDIACRLTQNTQKLAVIRANLRPWMTASMLCDEKTFTRSLEATYRHVWRQWCETCLSQQLDA